MIWIYIIGTVAVLIGISAFFGAPYVPSHRKDVKRLFDDLAPVGEGDVVLDIGSGDGLVLREASRRGARAVGYEIHPLFVAISKLASLGDARVQVKWTNAWTAPFPKGVTLIYAFAVGRDGAKLAKKVQKEAHALNRPLTLVCYGNALPKRTPVRTAGAYHLYVFEPLHLR
jgi:hypothetical protein